MHDRPRRDDGSLAMEWIVTLEDAAGAKLDPLAVFERAGHVPLPPYVERPDRPEDAQRYQTVYAVQPGAVAAPTAGLHFTPELLAALGVERALEHDGIVEVRPGAVDSQGEHALHRERYEVRPQAWGRIRAAERVLAGGTKQGTADTSPPRLQIDEQIVQHEDRCSRD